MVQCRSLEPRPWRPLIPAKQQPAHRGRPTLALDVNHTLVTGVPSLAYKHDFVCTVPGTNAVTATLKRPHVDEFLAEVSKLFEVVVFTSCEAKFADPILDKLDPEGTTFAYRLFNGACTLGELDYLKDLSMLGRGLERTMIVDDSPEKCLLNPDNWIPVSRFDGDLKDEELRELIPFLKKLVNMEDVRPAIVELQEELGVRSLVVSHKKRRV